MREDLVQTRRKGHLGLNQLSILTLPPLIDV